MLYEKSMVEQEWAHIKQIVSYRQTDWFLGYLTKW
jgi:hypothetical protein